MGPVAPVAEVRLAVRRALADLEAGSLVLVALSGGADSLALAAATAFEAPKQGLRAGAVVVDHALQAGSEAVAARASRQAAELAWPPAAVARFAAGPPVGREAAARGAATAPV